MTGIALFAMGVVGFNAPDGPDVPREESHKGTRTGPQRYRTEGVFASTMN
jgi:hypothetical protein